MLPAWGERLVTLLLLMVVLTGSGLTQAQPPARTAPLCADEQSTMMWQVQDVSRSSPGPALQVFGSIHVGKPELYPLDPVVETGFRSADNLVFEIDPRSAANPGIALQMQLKGQLPAGTQLQQVVSPRTLADLTTVLADLGIPLDNFATYKPWMITLVLANLQVNALGFDADWGLESYFMAERAEPFGIVELESIEQQIAMLDNLDQDVFLGYSLREYATSSELFGQMMEAWQCADHARLADILFAADNTASLNPEETLKAGLLQDQLYTLRNVVMADGIEHLLRTGQGSYFVVVGAGHLLGNDSILGLLSERGYTVTPVRQGP